MIKVKIKIDACRIWKFLDENQLSSVAEVAEKLSMDRQDVLLAIGWLAREDKIYFCGNREDRKIMTIY